MGGAAWAGLVNVMREAAKKRIKERPFLKNVFGSGEKIKFFEKIFGLDISLPNSK
jgi:hypothetical protein